MKKSILILLASLCCFTSCGDDKLPEDYVVVSEKVLAVKIEPPEALPGDTVEMSLLIGAKTMDQNAVLPVQWLMADDTGSIVVSPYNQPIQMILPDLIPSGESSIDIPVFCSITMNEKNLVAEKYVRITNSPVGENPVITGVEAHWETDAGVQSATLALGATFNPGVALNTIAFTSLTQTLPDNGNEKRVYRWYVTKEKTTDREIEVNDSITDIESLLGTGAKAAEFMESVVYSTGGSGEFNVYLVVRDNAVESLQDRLGTDFFHFNVVID